MLCSSSAVCKFSVYVLILSITFDSEGGFIALWNFVFFQSRRFLGFFLVSSFKGFHVCVDVC